jgi:hypothetical protein
MPCFLKKDADSNQVSARPLTVSILYSLNARLALKPHLVSSAHENLFERISGYALAVTAGKCRIAASSTGEIPLMPADEIALVPLPLLLLN